MSNAYQNLTSFKYEANLLYAESILGQNHILSQQNQQAAFTLSVKPEDYSKAADLIKNLQLDENEVDENNDGYIAGYEEWAEKRFVNGYFTGGNIPRWMFDKKYAKWFGPVNVVTGLFMLCSLYPFDLSAYIMLLPLFLCLVYIVCGVFLTIRGFSKIKQPRLAIAS